MGQKIFDETVRLQLEKKEERTREVREERLNGTVNRWSSASSQTKFSVSISDVACIHNVF